MVSADIAASTTLVVGGRSFHVANLVDHEPLTAWCEGNANAAVGESIRIRFDRDLAVDRIAIWSSVRAADVPLDQVARVVDASAATGDGRTVRLVPRHDGALFADLGEPAVRELTLSIARVTGPIGGVACISTFAVERRDGDVYAVFPIAPDVLSALVVRALELRDAFATCDAGRLAEMAAFPVARIDAAGTRAIDDATALATACRERGHDRSVGARDDAAVVGALRSAGAGRASLTGTTRLDLAWIVSRWQLRAIAELY